MGLTNSSFIPSVRPPSRQSATYLRLGFPCFSLVEDGYLSCPGDARVRTENHDAASFHRRSRLASVATRIHSLDHRKRKRHTQRAIPPAIPWDDRPEIACLTRHLVIHPLDSIRLGRYETRKRRKKRDLNCPFPTATNKVNSFFLRMQWCYFISSFNSRHIWCQQNVTPVVSLRKQSNGSYFNTCTGFQPSAVFFTPFLFALFFYFEWMSSRNKYPIKVTAESKSK